MIQTMFSNFSTEITWVLESSKVDFGQDRAILGLIIDIWVIKGPQKLGKGGRGLGKVRSTLPDGLGSFW